MNLTVQVFCCFGWTLWRTTRPIVGPDFGLNLFFLLPVKTPAETKFIHDCVCLFVSCWLQN